MTIEQSCTHYWMIDSPQGPTSIGTCKACGEQREFKNSFPSFGWEREGQDRFAKVVPNIRPLEEA